VDPVCRQEGMLLLTVYGSTSSSNGLQCVLAVEMLPGGLTVWYFKDSAGRLFNVFWSTKEMCLDDE
jgi:hypothetical protein